VDDYVTIQSRGYTFGILAEQDGDGVYRPNIAVLNPRTGEPVAPWYPDLTAQEAHETAAACLQAAVRYVL
jgi:hypothetical protein